MRAEIINRTLYIEKGGILQEQLCVYNKEYHCGEHYPQFLVEETPKDTLLHLCQSRSFSIKDFTRR